MIAPAPTDDRERLRALLADARAVLQVAVDKRTAAINAMKERQQQELRELDARLLDEMRPLIRPVRRYRLRLQALERQWKGREGRA